MNSIKENLEKSKYLYLFCLIGLCILVFGGLWQLWAIERYIPPVFIDNSHINMTGNAAFFSTKASTTSKMAKKPKPTKTARKPLKTPKKPNGRVSKSKLK